MATSNNALIRRTEPAGFFDQFGDRYVPKSKLNVTLDNSREQSPYSLYSRSMKGGVTQSSSGGPVDHEQVYDEEPLLDLDISIDDFNSISPVSIIDRMNAKNSQLTLKEILAAGPPANMADSVEPKTPQTKSIVGSHEKFRKSTNRLITVDNSSSSVEPKSLRIGLRELLIPKIERKRQKLSPLGRNLISPDCPVDSSSASSVKPKGPGSCFEEILTDGHSPEENNQTAEIPSPASSYSTSDYYSLSPSSNAYPPEFSITDPTVNDSLVADINMEPQHLKSYATRTIDLLIRQNPLLKIDLEVVKRFIKEHEQSIERDKEAIRAEMQIQVWKSGVKVERLEKSIKEKDEHIAKANKELLNHKGLLEKGSVDLEEAEQTIKDLEIEIEEKDATLAQQTMEHLIDIEELEICKRKLEERITILEQEKENERIRADEQCRVKEIALKEVLKSYEEEIKQEFAVYKEYYEQQQLLYHSYFAGAGLGMQLTTIHEESDNELSSNCPSMPTCTSEE